MSEALIIAALRLPARVLSALAAGTVTAIHAPTFTKPDQSFALCVDDPEAAEVELTAWGRCESIQQFADLEKCHILATRLEVPVEALQNAIKQNGFIWITYLRVYRLPKPITIKNQSKGIFLPVVDKLHIKHLEPILDDATYIRRKQEIENLEPPESLFNQIERILKEAGSQRNTALHQDLAWIERIGKVGNSSGGHEFEKLVRKSFIFLGFSNSNTNPKANLDPENTGGAGGIDLCCELPYPVVGECKASANQKIPTDVCSQLTYLGQAHFSEHYKQAIKIIIAAGSLNHHSRPVAIGNQMNVIKPETLEKLVKLKLDYPAAVDLAALKSCLENEPFGEAANTKLLEFINESEAKIKQEIKLRAQVVQAVKDLQKENPEYSSSREIKIRYNANHPDAIIDLEILRDLLIELSSPLAGYLGRVERDGKRCDQFYYLRDLAGDE